MHKIPRYLVALFLAMLLSGCFLSEKQLSHDFNAAKPLPNMITVSEYGLVKGAWKRNSTEYLVRKNSDLDFVYRASKKGSADFKERQFAFIPLGGAYFALEMPGSLDGRGKFQYVFVEFKRDGVLQWTTGPAFMKAITSNRALQQNLGASCFNENACMIDSITDLKNILAYILNQDLKPTTFYKFGT